MTFTAQFIRERLCLFANRRCAAFRLGQGPPFGRFGRGIYSFDVGFLAPPRFVTSRLGYARACITSRIAKAGRLRGAGYRTTVLHAQRDVLSVLQVETSVLTAIDDA